MREIGLKTACQLSTFLRHQAVIPEYGFINENGTFKYENESVSKQFSSKIQAKNNKWLN